ncbi:MAG TPA: GNAT family protein [Segetibacter sp.]|jgi:RimJ/RimL family protein N-acetyltransferase
MEEIRMRLIQNEDYKELFAVIERNRLRLTNFFPTTTHTVLDIVTAKKFTEQKVRQAIKKEQYYFVVTLQSSGKIIGSIILKNIDWSIPKGEFAYFIDEAYEGKGITSKAIKWLTNHAFTELGMLKLYIKINPENWGSKKVALNNGFELEGLLKSEFRTGLGALTDVERYGLLRK